MIRVAIQGVAGSYSEEAVRALFGNDASVLECEDFDATFAAVRSSQANNALVPIENKIVGPIARPLELLRSSGYRILNKLQLEIQHVLAASPGASFEDITSVRSHVEALKQCGRFLAANPLLEQIAWTDTASSIKAVVEQGAPKTAAICSRRATSIYGAEILKENIADDIDNWTIFYLVGN